MDKLTFLYEVIENIKHISSFDLIYRLIETRLKQHFGVKEILFLYYDSRREKFYVSEAVTTPFQKTEFSIGESQFLKKIVEDMNHVECSIEEYEEHDILHSEMKRHISGRCQVHPIVLKDKLAGIFIINSETPLDFNFACAILDIISIAFQRIVLAGHIMSSEEKEEHLEERYFKEILQNKLFECDAKSEPLGFAVISVAYNDSQYQGHKTTANKEVFSKVYHEIQQYMSAKEIILKYGNDRILIIAPGKDEKSMNRAVHEIKKTTENHTFIDSTNFRGRIKVSFGYSVFPDTAETMNDIYENALVMLHENIKIENWLKTV